MSGIQSHGNAKSQEGAAVAAVKATMDVECDSAYHNNLVRTSWSRSLALELSLEISIATRINAKAMVFRGHSYQHKARGREKLFAAVSHSRRCTLSCLQHHAFVVTATRLHVYDCM